MMAEIGSVGLAWYKTGTATITQGSTTITGVGTQWLTTGIKAGDIFTIDDTRSYEIATVTSNTSLTLAKPFQGASGSAQNYAIIRNWAATMTAELAARVAELLNKYESFIDANLKQIVGPKGDPGWTYKGTWAASRSYNALDIVVYNSNTLYIAILSHTSASTNAPGTSSTTWMSMGVLIQTATETTPGLVKLATPAEAQNYAAGMKSVLTAERVPDIFNSKLYAGEIFTAFNASMLGIKLAWITDANIAAAKPPLYELYGIAGNHGYVVDTGGQMATNTHIRQIVTVTAPGAYAGRRFIRMAGVTGATPIWSKWTELPTLSYSSGIVTLIVDGENGDDATANGTEARAYKTVQGALTAAPRLTLGWRTWIRIKAGMYEMSTADLDFGIRLGGYIQMEAFSGQRDVEFVFPSTPAGNGRGVTAGQFPGGMRIINIKLRKGDGTKLHNGVTCIGLPYFEVNSCEFENFNFAIVASESQGIIINPVYTNCNVAVMAGSGSVMHHRNGAATGTGYILQVEGGIIVKQGTQPAGTIATERVIAGQIV
jgi:hypothetical protein